ncbi:PREDICTED: uncharacterized protein LOC109585694 [Amphimedon queenslandica]|nr:PREDICTED: uncharacterized protein LOC109585694 [Amphimedon queenslandica]|eukprot:XP_019857380.1 PREDICTED: uncharacterized protein LOC109585694 [Amphimedon queenslandica]
MAAPTSPPSYQRSVYNDNNLSFLNPGNSTRLENQPRNNGENIEPEPFETLLDLDFKTVFYEHQSTPTIPQVYAIYNKVFHFTKAIVYNGLVLIFGIFITLVWAFLASILAFVTTWVWWPIMRSALFVSGATIPAVVEPMKAFLTPLADVHARIFRQIRINATFNGGFNPRINDRAASSNV